MENVLYPDLTYVIRVAAAMVLAIPIGLDRERKDRPAGLRTHVLVSGGAAAFLSTALILSTTLSPGEGPLRLDPVRALEAVVGGIGFLGAGTIFVSQKSG